MAASQPGRRRKKNDIRQWANPTLRKASWPGSLHPGSPQGEGQRLQQQVGRAIKTSSPWLSCSNPNPGSTQDPSEPEKTWLGLLVMTPTTSPARGSVWTGREGQLGDSLPVKAGREELWVSGVNCGNLSMHTNPGLPPSSCKQVSSCWYQ